MAAQPDFSTNEREVIDAFHKFVDREIMPIQRALGDNFTNPRKYWQEDGRESAPITEARRATRMASAKAGYYTMFCPKEFGGEDLGVRLWFLLWESLFHRYGAPVAQLPYVVLSHFTGGPNELWLHASESLRAQVMPRLRTGDIHGCFALTEPDAGSDSFMMRTTARRDGDHWIINGSKQWTSWSPTAAYVTLFAVTNKEMLAARKGGITCFYIPTGHPGFRIESVLKIFGAVGGDETISSYTDVRIPDAWRFGEVDRGFELAMMGVKHGRIANAGRGLGLGRWAMDKTMAYAKIRRTFGKTLSEHQTIQNYLAENAIKLYSGRAMALDCAARVDRGEDVRGEVSMLKVYVTRIANEVIDKCMQIHGGMGIANETHLYDAWHNTRLTQVGEGPNEIQLRSIAKLLLDGRIDLSFP